jgi:hypothetical protein
LQNISISSLEFFLALFQIGGEGEREERGERGGGRREGSVGR